MDSIMARSRSIASPRSRIHRSRPLLPSKDLACNKETDHTYSSRTCRYRSAHRVDLLFFEWSRRGKRQGQNRREAQTDWKVGPGETLPSLPRSQAKNDQGLYFAYLGRFHSKIWSRTLHALVWIYFTRLRVPQTTADIGSSGFKMKSRRVIGFHI